MEAVFHYGRSTLKMGILRNYFIGLVFILCCIHSVPGCLVFEKQYGNVTDDQDIEVGSPLAFECNLFPETVSDYGVTSKDLILRYSGQVLPFTSLEDNYTAKYELERSSFDDSGYYHCYVPIPGYKSPQLVCTSAISVGTVPQEVSNFTCIGYGFRNLSCSWIPPPNRIRTKYELSDYLSNNPVLIRKCPLVNHRQPSSCQFGVDTKPPYVRNQEVMNFILKGENALGSITQHFAIKHYEIVKPNAPSKVSLKDVSKDSMVIEILAPKGLDYGEFPKGLVYEIVYYSVSTKLNLIQKATVQNKTNAELKIENLVPHTQYKFEVRCHLNVSSGSYLVSDETIATEITKPDVPYMAPEVDKSGFDRLLVDKNVSITLYWKAVPSEFENGEKFHYIVKYHEYYVPTRLRRRAKRGSDSTAVKVENGTYYTVKGLDKDTAYMFTIVAANDVGQSSNYSAVLVVDKAEKLLPKPKDITVVSYDRGHYDISWKSSDPQLNSFTLAVCETLKSQPAKCEGPISFTSVQNRTHHKFFLPNSKTNYQFAVATTGGRTTSGLYWAPCTVTHGVVYGVKSVEMIPETSTSLKVTWTYHCLAVSQVVRDIEIAMCPSQDSCSIRNYERCSVNDLGISGWPTHRITNSSITEMVIGDLRPFMQYYAVIRLRTDAGWGSYSGYVCKSTMQSAPSDPPSDVYAEIQPIQDPMRTSIRVSFEPPNTPNGFISRYFVYYNDTSGGEGKEKEILINDDNKGTSTILDNVSYHTNYSIVVTACVDQACSPLSEPIFLYTGVSNPGIVNLPRVELAQTNINISWDPPALPNGPLDYYQIVLSSNDSKVKNYSVSGQNFLSVKRDCNSEDVDHNPYEIRVRAINLKDGLPFYGDYSLPLKTLLCEAGGMSTTVVIISICVSISIALGFVFFVASRMVTRVRKEKNTDVKLPKGLEYPLDDPLSAYDKFKSGLQNNHDSGIPYERGYERFFSTASQGETNTTEELPTRGASGRNLSGESNFSGKCQDSISSANTTKTHNSIDSGAEIESPPSPDSFCSDSGSASTTPRTFNPGLDIVNEKPLTSRDSGLEREGVSRTAPNANFSGHNQWYVKASDAQLSAYSRFAVRGASNSPPYVLRSAEQNLADCRSLSNSEPSVADFDLGDGTEPLVNLVMEPYSKFGLARSASNGINQSRDTQHQPGYSKFGTVYRPLKNFLPSGPHDQQVFPAATAVTSPHVCFSKKADALFNEGTVALESIPDAYSKFGMVDSHNGVWNGLKQDELSKEETARLQDFLQGSLSPSHTSRSGQSENAWLAKSLRDPASPEDFASKALSGGMFEVLPVPVGGPVSPSKFPLSQAIMNPENYAFRKACGNIDELFRCIDDGCLPELVLNGYDGSTERNCSEQNGCDQVQANGTLDEVPDGEDLFQEDKPPPNHPVPNVYVKVPDVKDSENAQVTSQSNSSAELV